MFSVQQVFHVSHVVDDLDAAVAWYDDVFSPRVWQRTDLFGTQLALLVIGDTVLMPMCPPENEAASTRRFLTRNGQHLHSLALYVDEPVNQFATHLAKYFENSIRENGLLAIALGGVVFTPGGSGTAQEIFTDAAQNDYTLYGVRSPMIFLGRAHHERSGLLAAVQTLAAERGWEHLVRVVDDVPGAVEALRELAPILPVPGWPLRRRPA